jgi:hypothetical protein
VGGEAGVAPGLLGVLVVALAAVQFGGVDADDAIADLDLCAGVMRYRPSSGRYIAGLTRGLPVRAPTVCRSSNGAPANSPPTWPWLARNSAMTCALRAWTSSACVIACSPWKIVEHGVRSGWTGGASDPC